MTIGAVIPLMIDASLRHPDGKARRLIWSALEDWVETCEPIYSKKQIIEVLKQCSGCELEPFELLESDYEQAALIARIAFSSRFQKTRFRVVSRQTLGCTGGCVVTNNLNFHYVERKEPLWESARPGNYWSFAPANHRLVPSGPYNKSMNIEAFANINERGVNIVVCGLDPNLLNWSDSSVQITQLATHSFIQESSKSLEDIDMRLQFQNRRHPINRSSFDGRISSEDRLVLIPTNPEATIRLTAHMIEQNFLVLSMGPKEESGYKVFIKLDLASETVVPLTITPALTKQYFPQWIDIGDDCEDQSDLDTLKLDEEVQSLLSKYFLPHESWINKNNLGEP